MKDPRVSIVIPVFNEQDGLESLFSRLYPVLDALGEPYEIVFVDDGSRDGSVSMLREQFTQRPDVTRVVVLSANSGQHNAILAGFAHARGGCVITLDADLQNPPEEIPRLLAEIELGHDYVGTVRTKRHDSRFRRWSSQLLNLARERMTSIRMTDQGCMLRAYGRGVVDAINRCPEVNTFIPMLAYLFAQSPTEIEVGHEERAAGRSRYSLYRLLRLNFDLLTGFSIVPLQLFSLLGIGVAILSLGLFVLLLIRRLVIGAEVEGVFTLFSLVFFLIGMSLFGLGLLGEYVGRIYAQVRGRPRYLVGAVLEREPRDARDTNGREETGESARA